MISLKSKVGLKSGSYRDDITVERIAAFCRAVGSEVSKVAPPTFMTIFRRGEFDLFSTLGIELSKVLHAEQDYQYSNPIQAGDCITFETEVLTVLEKQGSTASMQFITFETQLTAERGSRKLAIGKAKSTIVIREKNG